VANAAKRPKTTLLEETRKIKCTCKRQDQNRHQIGLYCRRELYCCRLFHCLRCSVGEAAHVRVYNQEKITIISPSALHRQ